MRTIVIIDDSEFFLLVSKTALEAAGYAVVALIDPGDFDPETIGMFDLLLIDINMPQYFGDDIVNYIKDTWSIEVPIWLQSTVSKSALSAAVERCNADGYISKSEGIESLVLKVSELLPL